MRVVSTWPRGARIVAGSALSIGLLSLGFPMAAAAAVPGVRADALPDLAVTASFNKTSYVLNEAATVTFTVKNNGTVAALNVHTIGGDSGGFTMDSPEPPGFDLAAGQSKQVIYSGAINNSGWNVGRAFLALGFGNGDGYEYNDANPEDNSASAQARVIGAKGILTGTIFHDADGDPSTVDSGRVVGVRVKAYGPFGSAHLAGEAVTGSDGTFSIGDLPVGTYDVRLTMPPGWAVGPDQEPISAYVIHDDQAALFIAAINVPIPTATPSPTATAPAGTDPTTTASPLPPIVNGPALPATGTPTALIGGVGLAVLAAGVALVLLARVRRSRPALTTEAITPTE